MRKVVIFGTNKIAECALSFFREDSTVEVVAFTADRQRVTSGDFCGLPVIPYEDISQTLPPASHQVFVAVGYSDINRNREQVMQRVAADGYSLASCISARANIMPGTSIGMNVFIFHGCTIDPYVSIGDGALIASNAVIGHHCVVENYCYVAYGAIVAGSSRIGHHSVIGCNSTIGSGVTIGPYNIIGDGALVGRSTDPHSVYVPGHTPKAPLSSERVKAMLLKASWSISEPDRT